jgi:hypothetical protein
MENQEQNEVYDDSKSPDITLYARSKCQDRDGQGIHVDKTEKNQKGVQLEDRRSIGRPRLRAGDRVRKKVKKHILENWWLVAWDKDTRQRISKTTEARLY